MFGYILVHKPELKVKELDCYQSYYCGLCKSLKKHSGNLSRFLLSYDMTFLYILLTGLYEPKTQKRMERCGVHPARKQTIRENEIGEYMADMSTLMVYLKCRDDWNDERKIFAKVLLEAIRKENKRLKRKYPKKIKAIVGWMKKIEEGERVESQDIDEMAGYFGNIMAELLLYREDEWEMTLRRMGFFLGKFIYIMDAYEDLAQDRKKKNYNPLFKMSEEEGFEEKIRVSLLFIMAECARAFEELPILENVELLRNIIYSGVWMKYEQIRQRESKEKEGGK